MIDDPQERLSNVQSKICQLLLLESSLSTSSAIQVDDVKQL